MKKTKRIIFSGIIIASIIMCLAGCTENNRVNNWGGEMTVDLPEGQWHDYMSIDAAPVPASISLKRGEFKLLTSF